MSCTLSRWKVKQGALKSVVVSLLLLLCCARTTTAGLSVGYYDGKCRKAERLIREAVSSAYEHDNFVAGALVRLHFHDCMVQGCDGSVLIDSTRSNSAEKDASLNIGLRFFEVIDAAKAAVERECPGVVSCADILAFAARDSVILTGGPFWDVEAGRLDGSSSSAELADSTLPTQDEDLKSLVTRFREAMGLDLDELVALSGSHTVGQTFCTVIENRIRPTLDPSLSDSVAQSLLESCPKGQVNFTNRVSLDITSPLVFNRNYFQNLERNMGVLRTDQLLYSDTLSRPLVEANAADEALFFDSFKAAMIHMGRARVLRGDAGNIRTNCRIVTSSA